jgi:signal transduction histidine kinase
MSDQSQSMREGPTDNIGSSQSAGVQEQSVSQNSDDTIALRAQVARLTQQVQSSITSLTAAKRRYAELLAAFSHELRSPLTAIRDSVDLLEKRNAEAVLREKARKRIERQLSRMTRLVDDLVEVSQIEHIRPCLRRARLDLRGVVQHAIDTVESEVNAHHHRLSVILPKAPLWLEADRGRLEQVFVNLLVNAAKYTDAGGHIRVSVQQDDREATVCVRDSGIGIGPEKLPHVFDLFMQVHPSEPHSRRGLGIGLALVRNFVEAHGGRVDATSAGLGQGSEFVVRLPVA